MFPKSFYLGMGVRTLLARASARRLPPIQMKKSFLEKFKSEKWFCKKSRNLSWVGADGSLKWLKSWKNAWNFALVEIWSSCRCDMKIIFGAFNNLDIKLLSHRKFLHHMYYRFLQKALKLKNAKKIAKIFFEKSSNPCLVCNRVH